MVPIQLNDSASTGAYSAVVTPHQQETLQKLRVIGWKWNTETVQKGKLRCYIAPDGEDFKMNSGRVLIAEVERNGDVRMGPDAGGIRYDRSNARGKR